MDNIKIGKFIMLLRKEKKLTQKELADILFVSDRAVSKWERGINMPDIALIEKLANVLDISIAELLKGEKVNEMNKENSNEIFKKCIPIFQKKYFQKKITKLAIALTIILLGGYFLILCIGQSTQGSLKWHFFDDNYSIDLPSFSSKRTKVKAERFLKALKKYDYEKISEMLSPNPWIIGEDVVTHDEYFNNLKALQEIGVEFTRYKYRYSFFNGLAYTVVYDFEISYNNEKIIISPYLFEQGDTVSLNAYAYDENDSFIVNNPDIMENLYKLFRYEI